MPRCLRAAKFYVPDWCARPVPLCPRLDVAQQELWRPDWYRLEARGPARSIHGRIFRLDGPKAPLHAQAARDQLRSSLGPVQAERADIYDLSWDRAAAMRQVCFRRREGRLVQRKISRSEMPLSELWRQALWRGRPRAGGGRVLGGAESRHPERLSASPPQGWGDRLKAADRMRPQVRISSGHSSQALSRRSILHPQRRTAQSSREQQGNGGCDLVQRGQSELQLFKASGLIGLLVRFRRTPPLGRRIYLVEPHTGQANPHGRFARWRYAHFQPYRIRLLFPKQGMA